MLKIQWPEPTSDALAVSHTLQTMIAHEIANQDGWISFARFMELALYAPRLGYYSGGAAKFGKDGDFTTAPETTALFGAALAQVAAGIIAQTAPQILEFGAGSGKLAQDMLIELAALGIVVEQYAIIELSGQLRALQQQRLCAFPQVVWLDRLPDGFSGVVIGNEVLDAMPVQLVVKERQGWRELGVGLEGERLALIAQQADCPAALLERISAQIPDADALPQGYVSEVHGCASAFMRTLGALFCTPDSRGGAAIFIDYGFPAHEYYLGERAQGTLMCHYRHHSHADPLYLPGLQDITSHLDFTAMAQAALDGGLELLGYTSQAAFLLDAGITELLLRTDPEDVLRYLPQANAVKKLLSPAEMGELFKVLIVGKGVELPARFARNDRSHRL